MKHVTTSAQPINPTLIVWVRLISMHVMSWIELSWEFFNLRKTVDLKNTPIQTMHSPAHGPPSSSVTLLICFAWNNIIDT